MSFRTSEASFECIWTSDDAFYGKVTHCVCLSGRSDFISLFCTRRLFMMGFSLVLIPSDLFQFLQIFDACRSKLFLFGVGGKKGSRKWLVSIKKKTHTPFHSCFRPLITYWKCRFFKVFRGNNEWKTIILFALLFLNGFLSRKWEETLVSSSIAQNLAKIVFPKSWKDFSSNGHLLWCKRIFPSLVKLAEVKCTSSVNAHLLKGS